MMLRVLGVNMERDWTSVFDAGRGHARLCQMVPGLSGCGLASLLNDLHCGFRNRLTGLDVILALKRHKPPALSYYIFWTLDEK